MTSGIKLKSSGVSLGLSTFGRRWKYTLLEELLEELEETGEQSCSLLQGFSDGSFVKGVFL